MSEFDPASPAPVAFCRKISTAEYDQQGDEETESELKKLLQFLDKNPNISRDVIRKRKQDELDMLSYLKVKVMKAVKGEKYIDDYFSEEMCNNELDKLKREMVSAFDYAQEAKGSPRRFSRRLAEKKHQQMAPPSPATPPTPSLRIAEKQHQSRASPPPPPPPPVLKPQNMLKDSKSEGASKTSSNSDLFLSIRNISGRRGLHQENVSSSVSAPVSALAHGTPSTSESVTKLQQQSKLKKIRRSVSKNLSRPNLQKALHDEITNAREKLRCINPQSPGMTPYQLSKKRREDEKSPDVFPMFNTALVHKFRNARSPSLSPSGYFSDSSYFDSPGS
ncbi:uncharacterized protein LOC5509305 [Nematostella vectensis]|uniref:uncharacterized protein LOC5509305 n=1 Tax=Nematostella vectensis TaxID=45351 RepID=UPI0020779A95|nr:uncharacterized protein LOC5509305 [Nematostella vectensis]